MALKVLIVDDETLARSRLRTLLGDCTDPRTDVVGEAGNAVQAMEQIQRAPCDLLLLDIHMPGADGLTLAQALPLGQSPGPHRADHSPRGLRYLQARGSPVISAWSMGSSNAMFGRCCRPGLVVH